jgi:hypothetical protein
MFPLHRLTAIRCVAFPGTTTSYHKQRVVAYVNFMPQHLAMLAQVVAMGIVTPAIKEGTRTIYQPLVDHVPTSTPTELLELDAT